MKNIFKIIHLIIVAKFIITGNDIYDYILGGIIAVIAYIYAFRITRDIANTVSYNGMIMSFSHWSIRTIVTILMINTTRIIFEILEAAITLTGIEYTEEFSIILCVIGWIGIAEALKRKTSLRKKYWF
jgi:hypothetical protein